MAAIKGLWWLWPLLVVMGITLCVFCAIALMLAAKHRNARLSTAIRDDERAAAAAAAHRLGAFTELRHGEWSVPGDKFSEYPAVIAFLVVLATPPTAMLAGAARLWWLGAGVSAVGMGAGWLAAHFLRRQTSRHILLYERGFVCRSEKAVHAVRWADITEVRESTRQSSYQGNHFTTTYYDLRETGGRRSRFTGKEFGAVIRRNTSAGAQPRGPVVGTSQVTSAPEAARAPETPRVSETPRVAEAGKVAETARVSEATRVVPASAGADGGVVAASGGAGVVPASGGEDTVPPRIAEVAARLGLGQPRGRAADTVRMAVIMLVLGFAFLGATTAALATAGAAAQRTLGAPVFSLAFLAVIAPPIWAGRHAAHTRSGRGTCYLFTDGLVLTGLLGRVRAFAAWEDIACIYWQRRAPKVGRPPAASAYRVWVLRRGAGALSIYMTEALGRELVRLHAAAVLPGLAERLAAGETLRFGPFHVGPDGVTDALGTAGWEEITGCDTARDLIGVSRQGHPHPVRVVQKHVPDVLVFEQLVRAFGGRPWAGAPRTRAAVTGAGDGHTVRSEGGRGAGWRERLLESLTPLTISRLGVVLSGGAAIAVAGLVWYAIPDRSSAYAALALSIPYFPVLAGVAYALVSVLLWRVVRSLTSALAAGRPAARRRWPAVAAVVVAALAGIDVYARGPGAVLGGLTGAVLAVLPAALVFALGGWAYLLTQRRVRTSRHRWLRHLADLPVAAAAGAGVLLLFHRDVLAHQLAAAVVFPLGAWCGVRIWLAMGRSRRLAVRAAADIVFSLLLGADLVLFLVWLANVLGLSEPEVAALRGALEHVGLVADLPWWLWFALLVPLAGASLAFAAWPARLKTAIRWSGRLHVVPSVDVSRRLLTGVHIGLLVIVAVGLTAPPGLDATLRGPLRTSYTVAVQRELEGAGEQQAYAAIRRQFSQDRGVTRAGRVPSVSVLTDIVSQIHGISAPPPGYDGATSTEDDLAKRIGQIQAAALALGSAQQVQAAAAAAAGTAGFDAPVRNTSDLRDRLGQLDARQRQAKAVARLVDQAGELAAAAVASTIQIPRIGDNEIVQIVREYLSGLIEDSPLKDVFAAWAARLVRNTTPPPAATLVVPDPGQLEQAAATELDQERANAGLTAVGTDPATLTETTVAAAVDLANQARLVAEGSTSCYECTRPAGTGDGQPGTGDLPGEAPVEEPPPEPHDVFP